MTIDAYDVLFNLDIAHRADGAKQTLYSDAAHLIAKYRIALKRIIELGERHVDEAQMRRLRDFREAISIAVEAVGCSEKETRTDADPTRFQREVAGKQAYLDSQDDSIHSNRYPAWGELTESQRDEWIERAAANRGTEHG
jgi:hypothetical protein